MMFVIVIEKEERREKGEGKVRIDTLTSMVGLLDVSFSFSGRV